MGINPDDRSWGEVQSTKKSGKMVLPSGSLT